MKICMLLHNDFTHDLRVQKEARDLAREGHEVTVVATRHDASVPERDARDGFAVERITLYPSWRVQARQAAIEAIRANPASLRGRLLERVRESSLRQNLLWDRMHRRFRRGALEAVVRIRPDAVHAHDLDTLDIGVAAKRRLGVPLVYDSHELWRENNFLLKTNRWRRERFRRLERRLIGEADRVVITTESRGEALCRWYGIEPPVVVMNCQDPVEAPADGRLQRLPGVAPGDRVLLYQGLIARDRGVFTGLDLLEKLPAKFKYVTLGDGRERDLLRRRIEERGLSGRAFALDAVPPEELPAYTASAHYGLSLIRNSSLSYYLSAPNKIFEYMTVGLPILAGDFPELRKLWAQEDLGELVDPTDAGTAARAILALEVDPERRDRIARAGRRLVRDAYNWPRQAAKLLELYESLPGRR